MSEAKKACEKCGSTNLIETTDVRLKREPVIISFSTYAQLGSGYPYTPFKSVTKYTCKKCAHSWKE